MRSSSKVSDSCIGGQPVPCQKYRIQIQYTTWLVILGYVSEERLWGSYQSRSYFHTASQDRSDDQCCPEKLQTICRWHGIGPSDALQLWLVPLIDEAKHSSNMTWHAMIRRPMLRQDLLLPENHWMVQREINRRCGIRRVRNKNKLLGLETKKHHSQELVQVVKWWGPRRFLPNGRISTSNGRRATMFLSSI